MVLTVYGFYKQYESLRRAARFGSGARAGYEFLASTLHRVSYFSSARSAVQARLVSLRREVNHSRLPMQRTFLLDQMAVLEHFLAEIKERDD